MENKIKVSDRTATLVDIMKSLSELESRVDTMYPLDIDVNKTTEAFSYVERRLLELLAGSAGQRLIDTGYTEL